MMSQGCAAVAAEIKKFLVLSPTGLPLYVTNAGSSVSGGSGQTWDIFSTTSINEELIDSAGTGSSYNIKFKVCVASASLSNGLGALRECSITQCAG